MKAGMAELIGPNSLATQDPIWGADTDCGGL